MNKPMRLELIRWDARSFEVYDYHRTNDGNIAIVYMADDPVTKWIVVHDITPVNDGAVKFYEWTMGHYCSTKESAIEKYQKLIDKY